MNKTIPIPIPILILIGIGIVAIVAVALARGVGSRAAAPQLSATEEWQLTGVCADLGKKKVAEKDDLQGTRRDTSYSAETRYDPAARRCYVLLTGRSLKDLRNGIGEQIISLYDGQTDTLLAVVKFSNKGYLVTGTVFDEKHKNTPTPWSIREKYPNKPFSQSGYENAVSQDALDYINELMGREKVDALCEAREGDPHALASSVECRLR